MKVWPLVEKPFLGGTFIGAFDSEKGVESTQNSVATIPIVSPELALREVKKAVRTGTVVRRDQETGGPVGFEFDEGKRYMFPNFGTPKQDRVLVERFPWEVL